MSVYDNIKNGKYNSNIVYSRDTSKQYQQDVARLTNLFKNDALEEVGLLGHRKADVAWDMAWDRGHSSGLYSVYTELQDLADLLL